jgi:hypothetical protein
MKVMNAGRMAALVVWGLMAAAVAAEPEPAKEDLSKLSPGVLQARLNTEQRRLETLEGELTVLRGELQKARTRQAEVKAKQFDTARVSAALSKFQRSFGTVSDATAKGLLPSLSAYQSLEQSAYELSRVTASALSDDLPRFISEGQRAALMDEVYGNLRTPELPSWSELQVLAFPASQGTSPDMFQRDMKEVVVASAERVKGLSLAELERLFIQDRAAVAQAWEDIISRAQASIGVREAQVQVATAAIDGISIASDARRFEDIQNDTRMNTAIMFMIGALVSLFIASRFFPPEVQAIIFQQRTLVEMVGMAFLLLTIIILGTNGKIEPAVLGTLLGTVGGYIFGQQVQARRGAGTEAQAPAQAQPAQPVAPVQPAQSQPAQPAQPVAPVQSQPAQPVAPVQPQPAPPVVASPGASAQPVAPPAQPVATPPVTSAQPGVAPPAVPTHSQPTQPAAAPPAVPAQSPPTQPAAAQLAASVQALAPEQLQVLAALTPEQLSALVQQAAKQGGNPAQVPGATAPAPAPEAPREEAPPAK